MIALACGGERGRLALVAMELCANRSDRCPDECSGFVPNDAANSRCWACEHFLDGIQGACTVLEAPDGCQTFDDYMPAHWTDPACVMFEEG